MVDSLGAAHPSCPAPVAIVGATASGKSALALALARRNQGAEIVSVDSMVVYRGMDIGTSKPSVAERAEVPHHLLDLANPWEDFSVQRFQDAALPVLAELGERGCPVILVGGTGLYLWSVIDPMSIPGRWPELAAELAAEADRPGGLAALHACLSALDPLAASRMLATNRRRVIRALEVTLGAGRPFSSFGPGLAAYGPTPVRLVGIRLSRASRAARIEARVQTQMAAGWLDEVRELAALPEGLSRTARQALGYRELLRHVEGGEPLDEAIAATVRRTRRFAKRQEAWFGRDPRIVWVDSEGGDEVKVLADVEAVLRDWRA
ncbi:MAG: tRNA (adenosine(37)-N6)-dimethylallyltransferase MiaA [Acidimicrobiales bacterium]